VVTGDGESLIRKPLKELIDELDPEQFWQVHRGTVVNSRIISHALREDDRLQLVLKEHPERLEVSRSYTHLFKSM
jgi:DNA-binding LytR/AlgR family response regulator